MRRIRNPQARQSRLEIPTNLEILTNGKRSRINILKDVLRRIRNTQARQPGLEIPTNLEILTNGKRIRIDIF
ncbi:hypothetical protein GCM10011413_24480 [Pedobacter psychrotolerans]|uniref:Uncharacterized protein n=2 Tax=Pedobacter psychrotolerans TaxID=1843235 RepID=A0ABQ1SQN8_9SPHI|nr:hypothetical protein GCM10011413_24480 [Pedobacter psychrotolerans]